MPFLNYCHSQHFKEALCVLAFSQSFVFCWSESMEAWPLCRVLISLFHLSKVSLDSLTMTCSRHHLAFVIIRRSLEVCASLHLTMAAASKQKVQRSHVPTLPGGDPTCSAGRAPTGCTTVQRDQEFWQDALFIACASFWYQCFFYFSSVETLHLDLAQNLR